MRSSLLLSVGALLYVSGCSVSVGAGAQASAGKQAQAVPAPPAPTACTGFESCQLIYTDAVARAVRCRADHGDCGAEERLVAVSYATLREQTYRELAALRAQVRDCAAK